MTNFLVLILVNIFWAVQFSAAKIATDNLGPITVTVVPLLMSVLMMAPFLALRKHNPDHSLAERGSLPKTIENLERQLILSALERSGGIQTRAAEELGINERVLRYKMKKYKISEKE